MKIAVLALLLAACGSDDKVRDTVADTGDPVTDTTEPTHPNSDGLLDGLDDGDGLAADTLEDYRDDTDGDQILESGGCAATRHRRLGPCRSSFRCCWRSGGIDATPLLCEKPGNERNPCRR